MTLQEPGFDPIVVAINIIAVVWGAGIAAFGLLLVPLPGPGWLIVFGGLAILAAAAIARPSAWRAPVCPGAS